MAARRLVVLLAAAIMVVTVASDSSAESRLLGSLLVRSAQVGPGFHATNTSFSGFSGVESLGCVHIQKKPRDVTTIGKDFATRQSDVTNVLYRYPTAKGSARTLATVHHILAACPMIRLKYVYGKKSFSVGLRLTRLPTPIGLLPHSIAIREDALRHGHPTSWIDDIYQPDGDILSLVFASGPHLRTLTAHAARASARNLS